MTKNFILLTNCVIAFGFASASLSVATAQGVILPTAPLTANPAFVDGLRVTPTSTLSTATVRSQVGLAAAAANVPLTQAAALSSFKINFHNGDHQVRALSVAKRSDGAADLYMNDSNGDDPFGGYATWRIIPGAIGGEVSTTVRSSVSDQISISVPPGPPGHRLVLGGFTLRNAGSISPFETGDTQIGRIALFANDDRGAATISGGITTNDANRPINIMVQYVWVPVSFLTLTSALNNNSQRSGGDGLDVRAISKASGQIPRGSNYVIRGFEFAYSNGATHNLLRMGVHLDGDRTSRVLSEAISWQDNNRDDPITWNVKFFEVR